MNERMPILKVFKKPHHSSTLSLRGLFHSFLAAIVVMALAYFIRPFGLKSLEAEEWTNVVITLGGISLALMLLTQFLLPLLIKDFYSESSWTTGKQFTQWLIMSFLISFATTYYLSTKQLANFPVAGLALFGITILPLAIASVLHQRYLDSKFERLAEEKNEEIRRKSVVASENPLNILAFRSAGEKLNLIPNQLIYVKIGDQAEFYYQNFLGIEKTKLPIGKEAILEELKDHPQFEVFQQDIIINVNAIQQITGSARGYEVQIARINEMVQISHKDKKKIDRL
ncbi:hypothetical protein Lbys_3434 [Leadbetterella byssophila DSM 17132]|uniref:HTH LytTR-type domain-containing protein n=1 Tax=Leadbetterella byssophila (strain DSM 17132 / JCM 16389 / KACC 11308 / NBRC 106382 / 4M15) TaxID=649349 RepID=E4RXY6_LEAB4|nr:hypothetical protein [Leadbetterella byssophila]ADQ19083.1 hypothetical protein Lbys_3434 [Leadbetterella byssophila DSM 17132]